MKLNCNHLSLGAPGTAHIKWESAGGMIARRLSSHIQQIGSTFYRKSSGKSQRLSTIDSQPSTSRGSSS
jgi:hypothetical protein